MAGSVTRALVTHLSTDQAQRCLNPKIDTPLFATNPLQLHHSPRAKILAFNFSDLTGTGYHSAMCYHEVGFYWGIIQGNTE